VILVDTSVWIDHLRRGNDTLAALLEEGSVVGHPFVTGELACGSLRNRREILSLLDGLPQSMIAEHTEVLRFLESHRLMGRGLGYVDVHLLASVMLEGALIWTLDKQLAEIAGRLAIAAQVTR
jgi:predicted nucleic acid-binding protein